MPGRTPVKVVFFRPFDVLLLTSVAAAAVWALFTSEGSTGTHADVYVQDRKAARFDLSEPERVKKISTDIGELSIRFGNGKIGVEHSPCPQKICMKKGEISETHEQIICLPARVLIRITGGSGTVKPEDTVDAVTP
jgi:hypothetical protein